ncbi:MAG: hypothetical protein J6S92_00690 [Oscillospiraceae bacterium]|nr:hypothetical protein [Oscillospiraceae bacterium]MBP0986786.1 hypothetical protein [Oscillospiraceae bacterium]
MKNSTKILLVAMSLIEGILAVVLFNKLNTSMLVRIIIVAAVILLSLIADAAIMHSVSASVVSDAKKLKDTDDYIRAFQAWLSEDTPFTEYIRLAINQLESLKRKQKALRVILDDSKDSPFLSTADEVDQYILANCKRILNRVMIYDKSDAHKYNMHVAYLQQVLGENAHVLSDFENLILEVSQIGDDANAATPCLNELTNALRSMRSGADSAWEAPAVPTDAGNEPPQQMMMQ